MKLSNKNFATYSLLFFLLCGLGIMSCGDDASEGDSPSTPHTITIPVLSSPANDARCNPIDLDLTWIASSVESGLGSVTYKILLGTDKDNLSEVVSTSETSYRVSLDLNKTYYWQITGELNGESLVNTNVFSFHTKSERELFNLPAEPSNPFPANSKEDVSSGSITLTWDCSDADGDQLTYSVYFGENSVSDKILSDVNEKKLTVTVETGKTYFWSVTAKDPSGNTRQGPVWYFKVR